MVIMENFPKLETATKTVATKNCSRFWLFAQVVPIDQEQSTVCLKYRVIERTSFAGSSYGILTSSYTFLLPFISSVQADLQPCPRSCTGERDLPANKDLRLRISD